MPYHLRSGKLFLTGNIEKIISNNADIYKEPYNYSTFIKQMRLGDLVKVIGAWRDENYIWWDYVRTTDGQEGWMNSQYLELIDE